MIPVYDNNDLQEEARDGGNDLSAFATFISELLVQDKLERDEEIGVARFVEANGTKNLTPRQRTVLEIIDNRFGNKTCERCGAPIPYNEIVESLDNGGYDAYCAHILTKEENQ